MKAVRTAAVIVGAVASVALIATGLGAPLGAGILGVSWGAISAGAGLIASISGALSAKPPGSSATGSPTDFKADPQAPVPYAIGRTWSSGYIVDRAAYGATQDDVHNPYQSFVIVWSGGGPIEAIESFKVDRAAVTFSNGNAVGDYAGWMGLRTQLGACPEAGALSPGIGPAMTGWGAADKLSGYAAGLWTLRFDKKGKKFAAGVPENGAILKGAKVYDPRLDSTYPGGSGACRALDEATYVWSENPWLHALTWALGRWQNGKRVLGVGMPPAAIDVAAFVEAANVADTNGWKVGGVVSSADDKWNVLKMMAQAGGGEPIRMGAQLGCIVSAPRVALATISSADLVGRAQVVATQPRRARINGIIPRIRSEEHGWEVVPLNVVRPATYLAEDGQERTREVDYQLVQHKDQGVQLAYYGVANSREFGPASLPLRLIFLGYRPGDCLDTDIPELGLNGQECIVINRSLDPQSAVVTLELKSETSAKHAAALGQVGTAPPTPSLTVPDLSDVPAPAAGSWTLTGTTFSDTAGSIPALVIAGAVDNPTAEAVIFEYRPQGAATWSHAGTEAVDAVRKEVTSVTPGTAYEAAVSYQVRGVVGARLLLGPVTAGDLSFPVEWPDVIDRPVELTDGRVGAGLDGLGNVARNIPEAVRTSSDILSRTGGGTFTGELAATRNLPERALHRNSAFNDGLLGWTVGRNGRAAGAVVLTGSSLAQRGSNVLELTGYTLIDTEAGGQVPCTPGEVLHLEYAIQTTANRADGTAPTWYLVVEFGASLGFGAPSTSAGPFGFVAIPSGRQSGTSRITVPANMRAARVSVALDYFTSGSTAKGVVDYASLSRVEPGATVGATAGAGGNIVNDVTVPGSGARIGDQRNLRPIAAMNLGYRFTGAVSWTAAAGDPATATISVGAGSALIGSQSVSYNATSAGVTGTGGATVRFYLYVDDATFAGGTRTLIATSDPNANFQSDDRVWLGFADVTFPTSGTGGGNGGGGGGGGGYEILE